MMRFVATVFAATLLGTLNPGLWPASSVAAQDTTQAEPGARDRMRQGMTAMRERMMAERRASQTRLKTLLDELERAEGDARIDAMASLVTELAEQQLAHLQHMGQMMGMMEEMMSGGMMRGTPAEPQP